MTTPNSHIYAIALHPLPSPASFDRTSTTSQTPSSAAVIWSISLQTPLFSDNPQTTTTTRLTHPSHPSIQTDIFGPSNTHTHHTSPSNNPSLHGSDDHVLVQILLSELSSQPSLTQRIESTLRSLPTSTTRPWLAEAISALQSANLVEKFNILSFMQFAKDTLDARQGHEAVHVDYLSELHRTQSNHVEIARGRDLALAQSRDEPLQGGHGLRHSSEQHGVGDSVGEGRGGGKEGGKGGIGGGHNEKDKHKKFLGFWISRPKPVGKPHRTNREWWERQDEAYGGLM